MAEPSFISGSSDVPPDIPPVETPDVKERGKLTASGFKASGAAEYTWGALWASVVEGLKAIMSMLASGFDEVLSLLVPFLTASQGTNTKGFYDLVAAVLNDLLGIEVAGDELSQAANDRGIIGGMQKAGEDFYNVLLNEFLGNQPDAGPGSGIAGLPGTPGVPLTPEQGVKGAQAFLGFILSFAVRQGNIAVLSDALSWHLLGQMREYGELMAKNLGLGRLSRRILQPIIQTTITAPLQQALNEQYRPHVMDAKQIATAFIRGQIDVSRFKVLMAQQGYSDENIDMLEQDSYTRLPLADLFLLEENGIIDTPEMQRRISSLGFSPTDLGLLIQAKQLASVQGADRAYAAIIADELATGTITASDFQARLAQLRIPKLEADAITRNAAARAEGRRKHLSLGFLKRAFLDATITLDELLTHVKELGYDQNDTDIIEVEVLLQLAEHKAAAAAKAKKLASKKPPVPPPLP